MLAWGYEPRLINKGSRFRSFAAPLLMENKLADSATARRYLLVSAASRSLRPREANAVGGLHGNNESKNKA